MTDNAWQVVGRLVRARRERLGLAQGDLQAHGGPGVTTVSKVERAAQANFPLRTQQQLEHALGWRRGTIEEVIHAVDVAKDWDTIGPDWEFDLIDDNVPDLTQTVAPAEPTVGVQVRRAVDLSDAELLAELTYRVRAYAEQAATTGAPSPAQVVQAELGRRGKNPGWLIDATGLEVDELMPFLAGQRPLSAAQVARVETALGWAPGALSAPAGAAPAGGQATGTTTDQQRRDRAV